MESFVFQKKEFSDERVVKVGCIQSSIVAPTSAPAAVQKEEIFYKVTGMIEAAADAKVNILCLPELWSNYY